MLATSTEMCRFAYAFLRRGSSQFIDYKNGVVKVNNSLLTVVLYEVKEPSGAPLANTARCFKTHG